MADVLAYLAGALVATWGVFHVVPTTRVLDGFEPISVDNRRVLAQEWVAEAVTMWGIATFVIVGTALHLGGIDWLYRLAAGILVVLGVLTTFTGARTAIVWFKVCVGLLGVSAALLAVASA
ncbi:MAG TPA: hypothetical protein VK277_07795 [Acidimicrobiales bacterium]|nr:hypothetical protein [Acidimicrobiales bacterium]